MEHFNSGHPGVMLINKMLPEFIFLKMRTLWHCNSKKSQICLPVADRLQFHYIVLVPISQAVDQLQYKLAAGYIAGF